MVATLLSVLSTFTKMSQNYERTFIAVKPDGVQRGLIGEIVKRFEQRGYKLVGAKLCVICCLMSSASILSGRLDMASDKALAHRTFAKQTMIAAVFTFGCQQGALFYQGVEDLALCALGKAHLQKHYEELKDKPFFNGLVEYMNSGPIFAMVWEGKEVVKMGRVMLGATKPQESAPGTIRGDFAIDVGRNVCHGSDSVATAKREIALWFSDAELADYVAVESPWVYE